MWHCPKSTNYFDLPTCDRFVALWLTWWQYCNSWWPSKCKSIQKVIRRVFEIMSRITPELCNTKSNYKIILITSITKFKFKKSMWILFYQKRQGCHLSLWKREGNCKKKIYIYIYLSTPDWYVHNVKKLSLDSCNWTPRWLCFNFEGNSHADNHIQELCY